MADLAPITVEGTPAAAPPQGEVSAVPLEPGRFAFFDPDGVMQSIPGEKAAAAVSKGYKPASEAEVYAQRNGALGTAAATAFGAGRGATFGVFDPLAIGASELLEGPAAAEETRRSLALLKEAHPTASMVGEIGGSLLPLALGAGPGGAGAALAEEGLMARAAARALSAAPRLGMEGAAIGMGSQLSEDVLGNHELVAQKYLTSALKGGLLNVLLGAGLEAGGGVLLDKLAARGAKGAERALEAGEGSAYRKLGRIAEGEGHGATYVDSKGVRRYVESGGVVLEDTAAAAGASGSRGSALGDKLGAFAEEQAAKGAMPSASLSGSEMQRLGKTAEDQKERIQQIGRTLLDEGVTTPGASKAVQAERLTKRVSEVGDELGSIRKSLEKSPVRPSSENVLTAIEKEVMAPLADRAFTAETERFLRPFVNEIAEKSGLAVGADGRVQMMKTSYESFEALHNLRRDLDKRLDQFKAFERIGQAPPGIGELKQIRGILEGEYERAADLAARDLGGEIGTRYRVAKGVFADLKTAEKWATKGAARDAQNQAFGLTDAVAAAGGMASGHLGIGLLAPIANKVRRTYGNQIAATLADKASKILGVQRAAEMWDARLEKAVKGFYAGGKKSAGSGASPTIGPAEMRALRQAVKNPAVLTDRVASAVSATGLTEAAPRVAQAMTNTMMRAAAYVNQNLPPEPAPAGFTFGPSKPRALGPQAQARAEAVIGALDMEGLMSDLERGRVDRAKVAALAIINPDAHRAIIGALRQHGIENQAELTHQQEVAISIITGKPIGTLMQPKTIQGFQDAHMAGAGADPSEAGTKRTPIGNASGGGSSRAAGTYASGTDKLEAGS